MVIDILEQKMEQEYRSGAVSLLKQTNKTQVLIKDVDNVGDDTLRNIIVS